MLPLVGAAGKSFVRADGTRRFPHRRSGRQAWPMFAEEALAQFAAAQVVVPVEVQEMCLVGLSDSLGVGVGGLAAESAVITRSLLAEADSGGTHVWASSQRLPPRDAAWLLGVSSHALDF
ncbi:MAG: hypothetical protein F2842_07110, partial [Actinobacteria bacterium]|nr:hypothetical protein [Actinomycetota bacterium]